jgi:hypothetical protein
MEAVAVSSAPALQPVAESASQAAPKSNRGLIIGLAVLVMALATAVVALGAPPSADPPTPPVTLDAVRVAALEPLAVEDAGLSDAGEVDAGAPEEDAGAVSPAEVDAGLTDEPLPAPKGLTPRVKACRYDGKFEKGARQAMNELLRGSASPQKEQLQALGTELQQAFKLKDCKAAEAVLKRMRAVRVAK